MSTIEICKGEGYTLLSGSVGFRYNAEVNVAVHRALFDRVQPPLSGPAEVAVGLDDLVLYHYADGTVAYKGIVRKIDRSLSGETATLQAAAAETVLEGLSWTPVFDAYNKELLCKNYLMKATLAEFIKYEYTQNSTGPKGWFTSIEVPDTLKDLVISPIETYQQSFLSLLESAISIHKHIEWVIEYSGSTVLPVGKLILIDASVGRIATPITLTVGDGISDLQLSEDGSECSKKIEVYGGGDYYEKDETLVPAWNVADEKISQEVFVAAPTSLGDPAKLLVTYLPLDYFFTSDLIAELLPANVFTGGIKLFSGKDFSYNPINSSMHWNPAPYYVNPNTGEMAAKQPDPTWRKLASGLPGFLGGRIKVSFTYAGPDAYQLYALSEPIVALRYRSALSKDPRTRADPAAPTMAQLVTQEVNLNAFAPNLPSDLEGPAYVDQVDPDVLDNARPIARIVKVAVDRVTWDERSPLYQSATGFSVPLAAPEYQEGRRCVRFSQKQLTYVAPAFIDLANPVEEPGDLIRWLTWPIKVRYTAWRNLTVTKTGTVGEAYTARFVFKEIYKYTKATEYDKDNVLVEEVLMDLTSKLAETAVRVTDYYGKPKWSGSGSLLVDLSINGSIRGYTPPVKLGEAVKLGGACSTYIKDNFRGLVNSIDLASGERGSLAVTFGATARILNPFEEKAPVAVDASATSARVRDISTLDRRSL